MNTIIKTILVSIVAGAAVFTGANIASAQSVSSCTSATLTGTVYPNGVATTVWFEMGVNQNAVSTGSGFRTASQVVSGTQGSVPVTQFVSNLTPSTTYYYRAMVTNTAGSASGSVRSFTTSSCTVTPPPPTGTQPTVSTSNATGVSTSNATLNGSVNGNNLATTGWFEWGTTYNLGNNTGSVSYGSGASGMNAYISGLNPNTTYYFRAVAQNAQGTVPGTTLSFTTGNNYVPPPTGTQPTVSTSNATGVSTSNATLNGSVNGNNLATTGWFEWGTTYSLGNNTGSVSYGSGASGMNAYIAGLNPNTTYYFRAVAQNAQGTVPGTTLSFTTGNNYVPPPTGSQPTVNTLNAGAVTTSSATLNGYVNGNGAYTTTYFEWGTNTNYGYRVNSSSYGTSGASNFSGYVSGLNPNTTYYFRAVAENSYGTVYGNTVSFTTSYNYVPCENCGNNNSQPSITTTSASNVTTSSGIMNGYVNGNGNYTTAWFEWGTNSYYGNTTSGISYGSGYSSFNSTISGLNPNTTYYYRAVARNSYGAVYGNQLSFTTSNGYYGGGSTNTSAPTAVTTLATQMTDTSAQLNSLVFTTNTVSSNAWFEWGTNSALGNKTNTVSVGNLPSVRHADTITGLTRGTTYYYRIVAENSYGRVNGQTMSFVAGNTGGVDNTVVINRPVTTPVTTVVNYGTGIESLVKLSVNGGTDVITAGERRTYDITWKNDSKLALSKVAVRIILPSQLTFVTGSRGSFSSVDNTLTVDIKTLNPGETGNVVIVADAKNNIKNGELIVVVGNLAYTTPSGVQGIADAYATHTGMTAANNLGASIFGAGTFLPTTLFGWLLLIILILLLVLIGNNLYGRMGAATPKH